MRYKQACEYGVTESCRIRGTDLITNSKLKPEGHFMQVERERVR